MPVLTYFEESGDLSPTSASLAHAAQSCTTTYLFAGPTYNQLRTSIIDLLGYTDTRVGDGRIKRTLPCRHPVYQWMFADSIGAQGVGAAFTLITPDPGPGSPIMPKVPVYGAYHYRVGFSPRNYNVWQDHDIKREAGIFYPKGDTGSPAVGTDYTGATEWWRFTEWVLSPLNNFITAQQGQMVFRVTGGGGAALPDGQSFQDSPRLYLPDSLLKIRWYQVPYRYLLSPNSYLRKFVGHVNQNDFHEGPLKGGGTAAYPAGSLLYLGATPLAIYNPPIPDEGLLGFNFGGGFTRSRLCDLELNFIYTARTNGAASGNTYAPANRNRIVAGHNLLYWLTTRKAYYATTYDPDDPTDQAKWFPTYNSFAFPLFFTDPDAAGSPQLDP